MRTFAALFLILFVAAATPVQGQLMLSDSSRLNDPRYMQEAIREIADTVLFAALDPAHPGLNVLLSAAAKGDFPGAYRLWERYRRNRPVPLYVTSAYRQLIDTEQLMDPAAFRELMRRNPDERDSVLRLAEDALRNRLRAWGTAVVDFGRSVDFDRPIGKHGKYGFHYWGWSKPLLQAFVLSGERKYLDHFGRLFTQWYSQRNSISRSIPDFDVVYYELGLGVRNRFFIEYDLLSRGGLQPETRASLMKTVLGAARWLHEIQRCEGYRPGNWQMHGSAMLVQIALTYPEFRESPRWLALGLQRLLEHADRDFLEDGGHSEHSPRNYTLSTYGLLRIVSFLLKAHDVLPEAAERLRSRLALTAGWWVTMLTPTGEIPAINDSHRGLFPRRILEVAAADFDRPEIAGAVRVLFDGAAPHDGNVAFPPYRSRHMPSSGFTVMRTGWSRDALYMNVNHGLASPTHYHNDILSFELYAYGRALAVDAGIGATYDDPDHVPWFRSSRAHNMVVINGGELDRERHEGKEIRWDSTSTLQWLTGWHEGYPGVRCRRTFLFVQPDYWLVFDDVESSHTGDTASWYLHSPRQIVQEGDAWRTSGSPGMWILPAVRGDGTRTGEGRAASTIELEPGKTQRTSWIRFDYLARSGSPVRIPVFLVPFRVPAELPRVEAVGPDHLRLRTSQYTDDIVLKGGWQGPRGFSTDAEVVWLRSEKGRVRKAAMIGGTRVDSGGSILMQSDTRGSIEIDVR